MKYLSIVFIFFLLFACTGTLSEEDYYSKAKQSYSDQNFEDAVANFKHMVENYPQGVHHAEGLFMLGFINANDLKNFDEAKKYYEQFTTKYPNHELADDANYELQTLGKDINELPIFNAIADSVHETPAQ